MKLSGATAILVLCLRSCAISNGLAADFAPLSALKRLKMPPNDIVNRPVWAMAETVQ